MSILWIFLVGMVGAAAPEIVRWYSVATRAGGDKLPRITGKLLVLSAFYVGLGGFVAIILPATNIYAAFYTGVSLPVLINTAHKKALSPSPDDKEVTTSADMSQATANESPSQISVFVNSL